ncbi:MAG: tetratricopeptide repeat protein [Myxococcota bacterium]
MHRHVCWWLAGVLLALGPTAAAQEGPDAETEAEAGAADEEGEDASDAGVEGEDPSGEGMDRNDEAVEAMEEGARSHFRVGGLMYNEGRFREAAGEFAKAYEMSDKPELLFNMYIAYRDAGLTEQAVESLREYLERAENIPDRRKLQVRLEAMEQTLEGREQPAEADEQPEPAEEPEPATAMPETEEPEEPGRSPVPWIVTGAGAALVVAATVTGIVALDKTGEIEDACTDEGLCPADFPLDRKRSEARRWVRATDALWPIGAAALGTGILLYFLMNDDDSGERDVDASVGCTRGGCAGEVRMRF